MLWLAAVMQEIPRIETVWPTSLIGLIGSLTALLSFFILLVSLWRADKRPVLAKIEEAKTYFTKELARVEKDMGEKVSDQRLHIDESLDDYQKTVTRDINGWGTRINDHHVDIQRHEDAIASLANRLIRSEADREQLNRRMLEVSVKVDENTKETIRLERSITTNMAESERRILAAIKNGGK